MPGRLALSKCEVGEALGVSVDFLEEHVMHELRVVRRGRRRLIPVRELEGPVVGAGTGPGGRAVKRPEGGAAAFSSGMIWDMRFESIRITRYKRFAEPTVLRVRTGVLAILGPNEVGKTSVIEALEHINGGPFAGATEFTDRQRQPEDLEVVSARFVPESADVVAVNQLLQDRPVSGEWDATEPYTWMKHANGRGYFRWEQSIERDIAGRADLVARIGPVVDVISAALPDAESAALQGITATARTVLESDAEVLGDRVERLQELADQLSAHEGNLADSDSVADTRQALADRIAEERLDPPGLAAGRMLAERRPAFIRFDGDARTLDSFTDFSAKPTDGLVNLLAAAGTTFGALAAMAGRDGGRAALAEEERRMNLRLEELFGAWSQRDVAAAVKIDTAGVEVVGRDRLAPIIDPPMSQRSTGMRMFASLIAFLHASSDDWSSAPVLLVDEAELHLHYDGQADLIKMFEQQDMAQAIIYTTHSLGCLPEDLGLGIVVVEETAPERSGLNQSFWTGGPGLSPLMAALGATAASFTPARRVVIGEGAHEAILLPRLLREARGGNPREPIGFQIVGGLAELSAEAAARLEEDAGTVVYIVDNDKGGQDARALLPEHVRTSDRVIVLGEGTDAESIEDFVAADVLVAAIDEVRGRDGQDARGLTPADVPDTGRADWAMQQLSGGPSPGRRDIPRCCGWA